MAATTTYAQMYSQFKRDIGLDESFGENAELAGKYGVKQAPTLIVPKGDSFEKIAGAGAIKAYLSNIA